MTANEIIEEIRDEYADLYKWEVWKREDEDGVPILILSGTIESNSNYFIYGSSELMAQLAHLGNGEGAYLLMHDDRLQRFTIKAETIYRIVSEEEQ